MLSYLRSHVVHIGEVFVPRGIERSECNFPVSRNAVIVVASPTRETGACCDPVGNTENPKLVCQLVRKCPRLRIMLNINKIIKGLLKCLRIIRISDSAFSLQLDQDPSLEMTLAKHEGALTELRKKLDDIDHKIHCQTDDAFLLCFLRHKKYDVDAAFASVQKYYKLRKEFPDKIWPRGKGVKWMENYVALNNCTVFPIRNAVDGSWVFGKKATCLSY